MMTNIHQFQQWRQNRTQQLEQLAHRFLFQGQNQQATPADTNDPLGTLPEAWGM